MACERYLQVLDRSGRRPSLKFPKEALVRWFLRKMHSEKCQRFFFFFKFHASIYTAACTERWCWLDSQVFAVVAVGVCSLPWFTVGDGGLQSLPY